MNDSFIYRFTAEELRSLVSFLRRNDEKIPDNLGRFYTSCEKYVYNSMTLDEAEKFFYET